MIIGLAGCIIPGIPGPILAYCSLLTLQFSDYQPYSTNFLVIWAFIILFITALDYYIPIYGTKKLGGSRMGVNGSIIGMVVGFIFLGPFGLIIGTFLGAWFGELIAGKSAQIALKAALGSFLGFLAGTFVKIISVLIILFYFITGLIN